MEFTQRLRPLFSVWTGAAFAAGFMACMFVAYPPRCGWSDAQWGDVATWASAIGSVAAVIVALTIATRADRRRKEERHGDCVVLASYIVNELARAQSELASLTAQTVFSDQLLREKAMWLRISLDGLDLSKTQSQFERLGLLGPEIAADVSSLLANVADARSASAALVNAVQNGNGAQHYYDKTMTAMSTAAWYLASAKQACAKLSAVGRTPPWHMDYEPGEDDWPDDSE